ncbi:MAG: lysophospholipid acyltransferase family protein [Actinomycetota bacterium]
MTADVAPAAIPDGIGRYQSFVRRVIGPLARRLWDLEVDGLDHVPADGPAVLCPNHAAAIDSFFLPAVLPRNIIYVGKSEYLDDWKTRNLFPALGMIPIDRRGGDHAAAALDAARQVLQRGGLFGIYPEGTRSRSGKLHKGHTGAARLAIETGAPIVPVGLLGTGEVQPVDRIVPRFRRTVTVRFGRPIPVERYTARVGERALHRELIDEVMYEIGQLTGLEYDPTYATTSSTPAVVARPEPTIKRVSSAERLRPTPVRSLDELLATG